MHIDPGDVRLSHRLTPAVPWGQRGLTAVFGMGTGGTLSLRSPEAGVRWIGRPAGKGSFRKQGKNSYWRGGYGLLLERKKNPERRVNLMVKPNELLVTVSSTPYDAYTSVLSTSSSLTALQGDLIFGKVSYLYAFSTYPDRTSLPSCATVVTTGSQEVRSPRSSRTKGKPHQISCAHHR